MELRVMTLKKLEKEANRREAPLRKKRRWGKWSLNTTSWALTHRESGYELDLKTMGTSSSMMTWIFQVSKMRTAFSREDLGYLIEALDDIFDPTADLCSISTKIIGSVPEST